MAALSNFSSMLFNTYPHQCNQIWQLLRKSVNLHRWISQIWSSTHIELPSSKCKLIVHTWLEVAQKEKPMPGKFVFFILFIFKIKSRINTVQIDVYVRGQVTHFIQLTKLYTQSAVKHWHAMKMEQLSTPKEEKYTVTYRDWIKRYLMKPCEDDHIVLLNIFISSLTFPFLIKDRRICKGK